MPETKVTPTEDAVIEGFKDEFAPNQDALGILGTLPPITAGQWAADPVSIINEIRSNQALIAWNLRRLRRLQGKVFGLEQ